MINFANTGLASWIFGLLLLVYLMWAWTKIRKPLNEVRLRLIGFLCALLAGFCAYFFTGTLNAQHAGVQASGGLAAFLLVLGMWWRSTGADPNSEQSKDRSPGVTLTREVPVLKLRKILLALFCMAAMFIGVLFLLGTRPGISIDNVPPSEPDGTAIANEYIDGYATVLNCSNYNVIVYAFTDRWHLQPDVGAASLTQLGRDYQWHRCHWNALTHGGVQYAALLVKRGLNNSFDEIPATLPLNGPGVVASTVVPGGSKTTKDSKQ